MNETPEVVTDALRTIATNQPASIRPERSAAGPNPNPYPTPRKSSAEIQAEIREQKLNPVDVVKTVKDGWKTSEFWVAIAGGIAGAIAVSKGWIAESVLADLTENMGLPYILGRSLYKFAPSLLERLRK